MTRLNLYAFLLPLLAWSFAPHAARAAESYDNCTGFITSLPTVIATQGTWCFNKDLNTPITSGIAITVNTNNVTIDCNDFKLGGLAAGIGTQTLGIQGSSRFNVTVRHCNIRGFRFGLALQGSGGGHAVEDNRFDGNTIVGVDVEGDGSVVRRNRLFDTGGSTVSSALTAKAILTQLSVDILDNTVSGVLGTSSSSGDATGIGTLSNSDGSISGNRVRGLAPAGSGVAYGVFNQSSGRIALHNNDLFGNSGAGSEGLFCNSASATDSAKDNVISGFVTAIATCNDDGGNTIHP